GRGQDRPRAGMESDGPLRGWLGRHRDLVRGQPRMVGGVAGPGARGGDGMGSLGRVLVTGAGGALGQSLLAAFDGDDVVGLGRDRLDVGDRDVVLQAIGNVEPRVVIHAGAWTDVDGCELDPDRAFRVNALGTRNVVEAARLVGACVVYISSDYVFDGNA